MEQRNEEVLSAKRDAGFQMVEMTQELAERTEELASARKQEEILITDVEEFRWAAIFSSPVFSGFT